MRIFNCGIFVAGSTLIQYTVLRQNVAYNTTFMSLNVASLNVTSFYKNFSISFLLSLLQYFSILLIFLRSIPSSSIFQTMYTFSFAFYLSLIQYISLLLFIFPSIASFPFFSIHCNFPFHLLLSPIHYVSLLRLIYISVLPFLPLPHTLYLSLSFIFPSIPYSMFHSILLLFFVSLFFFSISSSIILLCGFYLTPNENAFLLMRSTVENKAKARRQRTGS